MNSNSTLFKVIKILGFLLLAGISTWWTATSIAISRNESVYLWVAIIYIFAIVAAYIGFRGVKSQLTIATNPSVVKLCGFVLIWLVFWGFSFATNVHRNVVSQYGFDNVNAQLQSCKQYVNNQLNNKIKNNENNVKTAKEEANAKVKELQGIFKRNMDNTKPDFVGFGVECVRILNDIENTLKEIGSIYHDPTQYVIYDDQNDNGYIGQGKDHVSRNRILEEYNGRISEALANIYSAIDNYYKSIEESTELFSTLKNNIETFENSETFTVADETRNIADVYNCYKVLKKDILDKMPKEYDANQKVLDDDGNMRYVVYPSDRMFVFSNVWHDWWHNELPKDISLTGQFWMSFLIDFATYLLV